MKLLVVIPEYNYPHIDEKKSFILSNLDIISRTYSGEIHIILFNNSDKLTDIKFPNYTEVLKKGFIGQFLYNDVTLEYAIHFDHILILLDDVQLMDNVNIDQMIEYYNKYKFDILSRSLTKTSEYRQPIMLSTDDSSISCINYLELFCYLMSYDAYVRYYNLLDENSCWLWGIDIALSLNGIKCGLIQNITMHHHYKALSYETTFSALSYDPQTEYEYNLKKLGKILTKTIICTYRI